MLDRAALSRLPSPCYVIEEAELLKNLELLAEVRKRAGVKILLALKAFALWKLFPLIRKYLDGVNAASVNEARLGLHEFKGEVHLAAPGFCQRDIDELIADYSGLPARPPFSISFNSLRQWQSFSKPCLAAGMRCGLRVNPEKSVGKMPRYDPCGRGSRLGVIAAELKGRGDEELSGLSGLHFHALCEQNADELGEALQAFESGFGRLLEKRGLEWVNFGGGHHITRLKRLHPDLPMDEEYRLDVLYQLIADFKKRWPRLQVYLEPGEAVVLGVGILVSTVLDIVVRDLPIAVLDTSAEAHMPDVLAAPYQPPVLAAKSLGLEFAGAPPPHTYRLAGNTCVAGDLIGVYAFDHPLTPGDRVLFLDQAHYTMVKNNAFNGLALPAIALYRQSGEVELIREFGYEDYKGRLA